MRLVFIFLLCFYGSILLGQHRLKKDLRAKIEFSRKFWSKEDGVHIPRGLVSGICKNLISRTVVAKWADESNCPKDSLCRNRRFIFSGLDSRFGTPFLCPRKVFNSRYLKEDESKLYGTKDDSTPLEPDLLLKEFTLDMSWQKLKFNALFRMEGSFSDLFGNYYKVMKGRPVIYPDIPRSYLKPSYCGFGLMIYF
ncbi:MAG: hypothetical protein ACEPOW_01020 [Bacteroidales bacterium]